MKIILFILIVLSIFISCRNVAAGRTKMRLKILLQVVPEGDSSYSISWKDTLGLSRGYTLSNRPAELWCYLKSKNDTIGYYKGLSTPSDFTYFSTTDSIIKVSFILGYNIFSEKIILDSIKSDEHLVHFEPIFINIKTDLRKDIDVVLTQE